MTVVYRVDLTANARAQIMGELDDSAADLAKGIETAGWCFGPADQAWWGGLEVSEATGPGSRSLKSYEAVTLDRGYVHDLCELYRREGLELIGGWHVHPSGDSIPSSVDMDRIGMVLDYRAAFECRTQRALEIIASTNDRGKTWVMEPWVMYRGAGGITGDQGIWPEGAYLSTEGE